MKTVDHYTLRRALIGGLLAISAVLPFSLHAADVYARTDSVPGMYTLSSSDGTQLIAFISFEPHPRADAVIDAASLTAFTCDGTFEISLWIQNLSASDLRIIAGVAMEPKFQNGFVSFTWFPKRWPGDSDVVVRERPSDLEIVTLKPKEVVEIGAMSIPSLKVRSDIGFTIPVVYFVSEEANAFHGTWTGRINMSCVIPQQGKDKRTKEGSRTRRYRQPR